MKRFTPYSLLLVIAIILDRVVISSTQIGPAQSLRALFILTLLTTVIFLIIQYFTQDWHYANFVVLMVWVMLILYRSIYRLLKVDLPQQADVLAIVLIPLSCVVYRLIIDGKRWRFIRNPARVTYYFTIVFLFLFSFQVFRLARDFYTIVMASTHSETTAVSQLTDDTHLQSRANPDIYVIILDGYARQDVIQDIYNVDNSAFIAQLEKLGFYVADQTHSNYVQTAYSMASFWNFDYLKPWNSSYEYTQYLFEPIQNNRAFHLLDQIGYTTVSFEGEVQYTEIKSADLYLSNFLPLNGFESLLLTDSPLEPLSNMFHWKLPISNYNAHVQRIQYELHTLEEIPTSIPGPKIVYSHIAIPHPPFVFDQNGNMIQNQQPYSLWDDITYRGGSADYRKGYREQVIYINHEIIKVITSILAKSKTTPIIVLMGDHGPASMFNWRLDTPGCVWERTSNLYAILLPGHQTDGILYSTMTPVNTFRVIFNTYFGTDLPLLEDRSYLMSWQQPTLKVDVTDVRDSREGCTINDN